MALLWQESGCSYVPPGCDQRTFDQFDAGPVRGIAFSDSFSYYVHLGRDNFSGHRKSDAGGNPSLSCCANRIHQHVRSAASLWLGVHATAGKKIQTETPTVGQSWVRLGEQQASGIPRWLRGNACDRRRVTGTEVKSKGLYRSYSSLD